MFAPLPTASDVDMPPLLKRALDDRPAAFPDKPEITASAHQLLSEVSRGYLELAEEVRHRSRDENVVVKVMLGHIFDFGMQESLCFYNNARRQARNDSKIYKGNPLGKRPDALFKALLVRFVQCLDEHQDKGKVVENTFASYEVLAIQAIRDASQRAHAEHSRITAMRCFRIQIEDNAVQFVKWIFLSSSENAVMQAFRLLRDRGTVLVPGLLLDYDATPGSGRSKKTFNLLEALSLGGSPGSKSKSSSKGGA